MKKPLLFILITTILGMFFYSCKDEYFLLCFDKISEVRKTEFEYLHEEFWISFSGGEREEPYLIDGIKGNMIQYGVIKVIFFKIEDNFNIDFFSLSIDNDDYIVALEQNPFDNSLMGDIKVMPSKESNIFAKLKYNDKEVEVKLVEFTNNFKLQYQDAFKVFIHHSNEIIKNSMIYGELQGEFHITILENVTFNQNQKFWYISFFNGSDTYALCIDPNNAENIVSSL